MIKTEKDSIMETIANTSDNIITRSYEEYYQVAYTVIDDATLERELRPLESLKNHNAKFLLTMDYETVSHNGIKQLNVLEWLLDK